jgi:hypothetical protein
MVITILLTNGEHYVLTKSSVSRIEKVGDKWKAAFGFKTDPVIVDKLVIATGGLATPSRTYSFDILFFNIKMQLDLMAPS